ncbi:MAG: class I SAM-dependent methyltransferase [Deltaproteobacteria bacterium]|jgi:2-polyprenyl-3-methyl-5-hydroxy-6-metoxy-1,4-benzoquinol methylase|nr:class I SAM-dependent methyltransferase [Deltaproteobacteria bacterium]
MTNKPESWLTDPEERLKRKNTFDASIVMGTANFNRDTGRQDNLHPPFSQFIDPNTGMLRLDMLRARDCPVCGRPPGPGLFVKDGFRHVRCPNCQLIYVSLILREDLMIKYWQEELAWSKVLASGPQIEMDMAKYAYGLDLASNYLTESRKLLDVGAGTGTFVRYAIEQGFETTAIEFNVESVDNLLQEGIQIIVKPLELADLPPHSYDLVTMWEVLEHLADPKVVLAEAKRLLAPGGYLLLLVPNAGSLVTRLLHEKSHTFGGHSHLNHFDPKSLSLILKNLHYEIVELETVITELGTINNHLGFEDPYHGQAGPFCEDLTPKLIHERLWGSRLLALARPSA